ncbi:MAG: hypothetical protein ABIG10_04110 [bacterium]
MRYKKNNYGTATLSTLLILFGILAIALIGIEVMLSGFRAYMHQGASSIAYYAAEAGIERALMLYKIEEYDFFPTSGKSCDGRYIYFGDDDSKINFVTAECRNFNTTTTYDLPDGNGVDYKSNPPKYFVKVELKEYNPDSLNPNSGNPTVDNANGHIITLNSQAAYLNTNREIEVTFCMPDCVIPEDIGGVYYDWCGGTCQD